MFKLHQDLDRDSDGLISGPTGLDPNSPAWLHIEVEVIHSLGQARAHNQHTFINPRDVVSVCIHGQVPNREVKLTCAGIQDLVAYQELHAQSENADAVAFKLRRMLWRARVHNHCFFPGF